MVQMVQTVDPFATRRGRGDEAASSRKVGPTFLQPHRVLEQAPLHGRHSLHLCDPPDSSQGRGMEMGIMPAPGRTHLDPGSWFPFTSVSRRRLAPSRRRQA